jgi:actin-related protein
MTITQMRDFRHSGNPNFRRLAPETMKIKVVTPPQRKYVAWFGEPIVAFLANFPQNFITHENIMRMDLKLFIRSVSRN